jgi:hypothetical protein
MSRQARFQHRADFGRVLIMRVMEAARLKKIELPEVTLSVRTGMPQLVGEVHDIDLLPPDLVRVKREPDRKAIRAALEAGRQVPGYLLNNGPPSLQVRVK